MEFYLVGFGFNLNTYMKLRVSPFITDADISTQCSSPEECYQEREAWITVEQFILLLRERNAKPGAW